MELNLPDSDLIREEYCQEDSPLIAHSSNMKAKQLDKWLKGRSLTVDVLAALFGVASWVAINGLWVELPLLVQALPEGWSLPSYLSVIIQIANVGPLLYGLLSRFLPHIVTPVRATWVTLGVGVAASILLPIFWDETAQLFGANRSVALLALTLFLSLVDCTSSVLFLPYVGLFKSIYLPSYLLGEGLSALLPSLVATIQGVGQSTCVNSTDPNYPGLVEQLEPPLFSTEVFFTTLAVMMVISTCAFGGLEHLSLCKKERNVETEAEKKRQGSIYHIPKHGTSSLICILLIQFWLSMWANGFMVSLQTYSCMPYGSEAYHWAVILFNAANPLACLLALYKPCLSLRGISALLGASSVTCAYLLWTAATSPAPPLVESVAGGILVVIGWFLFAALTCYAKVSAACVLRQNNWGYGRQPNYEVNSDNGSMVDVDEQSASKPCSKAEGRLFYYGVSTQVGSLIGSIIAFVLVNILVVFQASYPCQS